MTAVEAVFFPLDKQLNVQERNWSESVIREAVWLSGASDSYARAEEILVRIGRLEISESTLWQHVKKRGQKLEEAEEIRKNKAIALPQIDERPRQRSAGADRMGVAMDGGTVHIREEGWKEFKVGALFEIEKRSVRDPKTDEWGEQAYACNNSYVAHLGEAQTFGPLVYAEAQSRDLESARNVQVIGDGAHWIWNLADDYFPRTVRTVDWYHATQYLHEVAQLLYPASSTASTRWYNRAETKLFQGKVKSIITSITNKTEQQPTLDTEAISSKNTYFRNNDKRMQYMEFREDGFLIGSGIIESGVKQFKARFTGPGMRWSRRGLQRLIPIRAAVLSKNFDALWADVFSSPPN